MLRPSSRLIVLLTVAGLALLTTVACAQAPTPPPPAASATAPPSTEAAAETPKPPSGEPAEADPNAPEKEYQVTLVNGSKLKVQVFPSKGIPGKTLKFDPEIAKTDMNVYAVALNSMWNIYGRQTGNFKATDAVATQREVVNGTVVLYKVTPKGKFIVFPLIDPEKKTMTGAMVWME